MVLSIALRGDQKLIERIKEMPQTVHEALVKKVSALALKMERKVKMEKLSGQVLHKRTGALMSSVFSQVQEGEHQVIGIVGAGRGVPYAAIHEFGGTINHPGGTAYWVDGKTGIARFVSNAKAAQLGNLPRTRPHTIKIPQRSYLRSTLKEMTPEIKQGLADAVREGMKIR